MGEHVGHLSQLTFAASVVRDHYKRLKVQKKALRALPLTVYFVQGQQ